MRSERRRAALDLAFNANRGNQQPLRTGTTTLWGGIYAAWGLSPAKSKPRKLLRNTCVTLKAAVHRNTCSNSTCGGPVMPRQKPGSARRRRHATARTKPRLLEALAGEITGAEHRFEPALLHLEAAPVPLDKSGSDSGVAGFAEAMGAEWFQCRAAQPRSNPFSTRSSICSRLLACAPPGENRAEASKRGAACPHSAEVGLRNQSGSTSGKAGHPFVQGAGPSRVAGDGSS